MKNYITTFLPNKSFVMCLQRAMYLNMCILVGLILWNVMIMLLHEYNIIIKHYNGLCVHDTSNHFQLHQ